MIWNANITSNQASGDIFNMPTAHYVIANNIIETDQHQIAGSGKALEQSRRR